MCLLRLLQSGRREVLVAAHYFIIPSIVVYNRLLYTSLCILSNFLWFLLRFIFSKENTCLPRTSNAATLKRDAAALCSPPPKQPHMWACELYKRSDAGAPLCGIVLLGGEAAVQSCMEDVRKKLHTVSHRRWFWCRFGFPYDSCDTASASISHHALSRCREQWHR